MVENTGAAEYKRLMETARNSRKKKSVMNYAKTGDLITNINNSKLRILQNNDDRNANYHTCLETSV